MITQLFIEKRGDCYNVVCNDFFVPVAIEDIDGAIEILTHSHYSECEFADDIAGVRVGYKALDLLGVAYGGEVRVVPAFQLLRTIERLTAVTE